MTWRMKEPCKGCPFSNSPGGKRQRAALTRARWQEITAGLMNEQAFFCHETTEEDEDGDLTVGRRSLVCAGSLEWSEQHGVSSNYQRVCERLDYFAQRRKASSGRSGPP